MDDRLSVSNRPGSGGLRRKCRAKKSLARAQSLPNLDGLPGEGDSPGSMGARQSDQNNVVLLLRVDRFDLQRDRLADEVAELGERLRLLVEKEIDHRLGGQDAE